MKPSSLPRIWRRVRDNPRCCPSTSFSRSSSRRAVWSLRLLKKVGADPQRMAAEVTQELDRLPKQQGGLEVGFSRKARDLIEAAEREADKFKDEYTSTEHLLLAFAHKDFGAPSQRAQGRRG